MNRREFLSSVGLGVLLTTPAIVHAEQQKLEPISDDIKTKLNQEGKCYSALSLQSGYDPEPSKTGMDMASIKVCPRYTKHVNMIMKPGPDEELYVKFNDGDWRRIVTVG